MTKSIMKFFSYSTLGTVEGRNLLFKSRFYLPWSKGLQIYSYYQRSNLDSTHSSFSAKFPFTSTQKEAGLSSYFLDIPL